MKINIKATNISLTPAISNYINKKIFALEKFIKPNDNSVFCQVEVAKTTRHHKSGNIFRAEIHIKLPRGDEYYAAAETEDLYASLDEVKDNIIRKLTSKRKRTIRLFRKGGIKIKNLLKGAVDVGGKGWKKIRNKK